MIKERKHSEKQLLAYKRNGELTKLRWADPEYRQRVISKLIATIKTPEHIAKVAAFNNSIWNDPEKRNKRVESLRANKAPKAPKFTDQEVRDIRDYLDCGYTVGEIAAVFKVSGPIISYIKSGKTYKQVK